VSVVGVCPKCHAAQLVQQRDFSIFKCSNCKRIFHIISDVDVNQLAHKINDSVCKTTNMTNAEIILAVTQVTIIRSEQKG
jgi:ribosomal protein L37AE/L43A